MLKMWILSFAFSANVFPPGLAFWHPFSWENEEVGYEEKFRGNRWLSQARR